MRHKMALWAVSLALFGSMALVAGADSADAVVNPWKTFAKGNAVGRGTFAFTLVSLTATTLENPTALRYVVTGNPAATGHVHWDIHCWNEGGGFGTMIAGEYEQALPITKKVSEVNVASWEYCNLGIMASRWDVGTLQLTLQAKYPAG